MSTRQYELNEGRVWTPSGVRARRRPRISPPTPAGPGSRRSRCRWASGRSWGCRSTPFPAKRPDSISTLASGAPLTPPARSSPSCLPSTRRRRWVTPHRRPAEPLDREPAGGRCDRDRDGALRLDEDRAFAFLRRVSSTSNTRLRDVAVALVARTNDAAGVAEAPRPGSSPAATVARRPAGHVLGDAVGGPPTRRRSRPFVDEPGHRVSSCGSGSPSRCEGARRGRAG